MKKILIGLAALVAVMVAAVFVVPPLIDWKSFEPQIAKAFQDATGRELRIDGDIEISLVPLELSISGIRLSNAPGMRAPEMVTVASITAKLQLLPLLTRSVVVDSFVITDPAIFLEVDAAGRPNWVFDIPPRPEEEMGELPISDLRLGDVRIEGGEISYVDAVSGQTIVAKDMSVKLGLAGLVSPLTLAARLILNDEPVSLDVALDSPDAVLSGGRFEVEETLDSTHITARFTGAVQQEPVPGLDGTFNLDIGSVGKLAAWLGRPLDQSRPDPGPLKVYASLSADGAKLVIDEATINGTALDARASGSFDGSGDVAKVVLNVESGVLDIDRYLPPPSAAPTRMAQAAEPESPGNPLAALGIEPFDLTPLRRTEAEVNIAIGGIKMMGFEVGRVALTTTLKGGVLAAELRELGLYGGTVTGTVELDGSGDALGVSVALNVDAVDVGALAAAATGGEAPIAGILSGTVNAKGTGTNPRALVESLSANVTADLGGIDLKDAPVGAISELKVALDIPGIESPPTLTASVVYNKERVDLDVTLDPLKVVLSGDRFALKATVASNLVNAGYAGAVQRAPVPGLDGTFDLDIGSVGKLAAWLGQPLDAAQPDPGPLKVHAVLSAVGPKVVLTEATINGTALEARSSGSFDGSGEIAKVVLDIESGVLDIDRYLPPPAEAAPVQETADTARVDPLAALSTEAFDLTALRGTEAEINVAIGGVRAMGFEVGRIAFATTLKGGVLAADLSELALYGGTVKGTIELDASGDALGVAVALDVAGVDVGALAVAATGEAPIAGILSSTVTAKGTGTSPRALVESLSANLTADLGGIDLKDAPVGAISELKVALDLPGLESPPTLTASVVYNKERVAVDVTLDPIKTVLAGERFALKVAVASNLVNVRYDGAVQQAPVPGLDGTFDLDIASVGELAAWLGQPLDAAQPDPGPLKVHAKLSADGPKVVIEEATITGTELDAKASGSFDGSGEIAKVVLKIESGVLDIDRYLPPPTEAAEPAPQTADADPLAALPTEPFDLAPLRQTEAEVTVAIGGIKAMGFEVGRVALTTTLKGGLLTTELSELSLYGGTVTGTVELDGSGDALGVAVALDVAAVDVGALAVAATGEAPIAGILSSTVTAKGRGTNPRALVESLSANLTADLGGIEVKDVPLGAISELKVALDIPGLSARPTLTGSVVYNQERVAFDVTLDPLGKVLSGERFALNAKVASNLMNAGYAGGVRQKPSPGLDGTFDLDVGSLGELAAWLGQPLDAAQPDPGPLKVRAVLSTDGPKLVIEEATISGKALEVRASGSVDGSGEIPKVILNIESGVLDLDQYLPPRAPVEEAPAPS